MKVSFTNGTLTTYGIAPATFTTSDPLTQFVIEHCDKFKRKEIEIVRTVDDGRPVEGIVIEEPSNTAQAAATAPAAAAATPVTPAEPVTPVAEPQNVAEGAGGENTDEMHENGGEEGAGEGDNGESQKAEAEVTIEDDGTKVVRIATKADAIEWLKENFPANNYTATALRTKTAFEAACAECKVKFIIANA